MRRRNVPCSPCSGGSSSGDCCGLKEKLRILWDRTIGSILRINGISPDGDGDFTIEAGDNIYLTERGTGNGLRISTTGGISYYESGDSYVNVDNNDLEISVNVGTGGLAKDDDLQTVAQAVTDILDGTSTVPEATHATSADSATNATNATNAQYLGDNTSNVGSDTKPIKIVNGQAVAVANAFAINSDVLHTSGNETKNGDLNITNHDYLATLTSPNKRMRIWPYYIDNTYQGFQIDFGPNNNNNGGIRVLFNQTAGTVGLVLIKTINGSYSEKAIDNF